jgi:Flp pilus assembly protein TadD
MARKWDHNPVYEAAVERFNSGDPSAAARLLATAIAAQPERARIHSGLAVALLHLERIDEARAAAARGRELAEEGDPYPHQVCAETLDAAGDYDGAITALHAARHARPRKRRR